MSIHQVTFSDSLKMARVIPIFKGENEQLVQNYRPISLLPFHSKKLDKNVDTHVIELLKNYVLDQFVFRIH